jgi:hypothetical protein
LIKTERKRESNTVDKDRKKERAIPLIQTERKREQYR